MKNYRVRNIALAGVALVMAMATEAAPAFAGAAWEFTSAGNSYTDGTWDFATAFTANANTTVSGLGYYADPLNGQVDANPVALYQCSDATCSGTGTLLASATVTDTYALNGHFRYVTIPTVTLTAGSSYEVAGVSFTDNYTWDDVGFHTDSAISIIASGNNTDRWINGTTTPDFLNFTQSDISGQDGFWGPNLYLGAATGFTNPVPLPGALPMFGVGLLALGVTGYKMKKAKVSSAAA